MNTAAPNSTGLSAPAAVAVASCAFAVPLLLSFSTVPAAQSPTHSPVATNRYESRVSNRPDVTFPVAWSVIEAALAVAGYRLSRVPASPAKDESIGLMELECLHDWRLEANCFSGSISLGVSTLAAARTGCDKCRICSSSEANRSYLRPARDFRCWDGPPSRRY